MAFQDEKLWELLMKKCDEEDKGLPEERITEHRFISAVEDICKMGVDRAKTIRDTFPMYTLHDETHICNVMRLMYKLLGKREQDLSRDETAMLIMAACCHDIGMSCSESEKEELLRDTDRLNKYLENHRSEYVKAYSNGNKTPQMTDDMIQNYLRCIHHERAFDLLCNVEWPDVLLGHVDCEDLIHICQSHGMDAMYLNDLDATETVDLRFCAIMLRLADILDFDTSRAPKAVYEYSGFDNSDDDNVLKSREEWQKHLSSQGFDFDHINRENPYELPYNAVSSSMQVEQTVNVYLDWVNEELLNCGKQIKRFKGKWDDFILPIKIKRKITPKGYLSGEYRLTLDQDKILDLLIGNDLYSDTSVFVRELIQNSIDAVRTRQRLDKDLPSDWKPQIKIRTWMDNEGYHWFRIEDNGIGMNEDIIKEFFLKIGRSYYTSDTFKKAKIKCSADMDYVPISRFGIGILSCFMGDKNTNRVEISTKRFNENGEPYSALRMSMHGMNGYYYMASKNKNHVPDYMKGITDEEKSRYLQNPGTAIAVRTNLYQTGKYRGFKEIVDKYVVYPEVPIQYDGIEGHFDYPTEQDFIHDIENINPSEDLNKKGVLEFELSKEQLDSIHAEVPEINFQKPPKLVLKCVLLKDYTKSPYLSGAMLVARAEGEHEPITVRMGNQYVKANVNINVSSEYSYNQYNDHKKVQFTRGENIEKFNIFVPLKTLKNPIISNKVVTR